MDDEEVYWRDLLTRRENKAFVEIDFSHLSHRKTDGGLEFRSEGVPLEFRDLGEDTQNTGGVTVGTDIAAQLYRHLVERNVLLRNGATVLNTNHGRSIQVPKSTVAGTASITGEGTAISENDPVFGQVTLDSWKYGQILQISNELLEDSEVRITDFIAFDMGCALGQASGAHYVTGSGTNQPRGLITATAADVGTAVQVGSSTVEYGNLIDLYYGVETPYRERGSWLMNASTLGVIHELTAPDGSYLMRPFGDSPNQLFGRPVVVDPAVASIGSANLSVAFGDFYFIRQAPVRIEFSEDFAFNTDQRTYRAVLRSDGDLVDQTGAVDLLDTD